MAPLCFRSGCTSALECYLEEQILGNLGPTLVALTADSDVLMVRPDWRL